jgi:iron(III) transport system substrate-binding protein
VTLSALTWRRLTTLVAVTLVGALTFGAAACSSNDSEPAATVDDATRQSITVYSGRSEELVGPLFETFTETTGITVNARYGDTAELAAQILEEGNNSPADVLFAQDAGALGAIAEAGRFAKLDDTQLDAVPAIFRSPDGLWVGVSGRARVVVYNTDNVDPADLPDDLEGFTDPQWAGRVGWAPTNGSFQSFVTAKRVLDGDEATGEWLQAMAANNTQAYEKNSAILAAVAAGEIDAGLVNHYYLFPFLNENPDAPIANQFASNDKAEALVNVAGVGILTTAANSDAASEFVSFLLSDTAQEYFSTKTYEYPLVTGVTPSDELPALADIDVPDLDLTQLADLAGTLELLQTRGVL